MKSVSYPGLVSHPDHEVAKRQMNGGFGGMLAVEFHDEAMARRVAEGTRVFLLAESLGGVESLIAYPPLMSHATMTEAQLRSVSRLRLTQPSAHWAWESFSRR